MNSIWSSVLIFICVLVGTAIGLILRAVLPSHHLSEESRDAVKLGVGLIATLTALVLGLLVSSAKGSFDAVNTSLVDCGTKIVLLDHTLAAYGPETAPARAQLRRSIQNAVAMFWPGQGKKMGGLNAFEKGNGMERIQAELRRLAPQSDAQRSLQAQAIQFSNDLLESRWLMVERAQLTLPPIFFIMLLFWLTVLFACFGLLAPHNETVIVVLLVSAMSVTGAMFLIEEMNTPLSGVMKISSAPITKALEHIGE